MRMFEIKHALLNLCFPRELHCAICGKEIEAKRKGICETCAPLLAYNESMRNDLSCIDALYAPFEYKTPLRECIHRFKYENARYLSYFFAQHMRDLIPNDYVLCPVPLHPKREKERGYSQTHVLCEQIAVLTKQSLMDKTLLRIRDTPSQTKLDATARKQNMHDAFKLAHTLPHQKICLIDDVASTGSTLSACAAVLSNGGVQHVIACTIAF